MKIPHCAALSAIVLHMLATPLAAQGQATAGAVAEARALLEQGDALGAELALSPLFDSTQPHRLGAEANHLMGLSQFLQGDFSGSRRYFQAASDKGWQPALPYLARLDYLDLDLEGAQRLLSQARKAKGADTELIDLYQEELDRGRAALDNVQELRVLEKLQVPAEDFYRHIRLPRSAGALLPPDSIPFEQGRREATFAFANEARDYMMWCQSDPEGNFRIVESSRLTDGRWENPSTLSESLAGGGDTDFPFMRADGTTLYFSSTGGETLGGLDLFVAVRDPQDGSYLAPRNMGMPFNSPYDDFMLAVDEENGICWLVSDREQLGDRVTIYVYLLEENRRNHDAGSENVADYARIAERTMMAEDDPLRREKLEAINRISSEGPATRAREFTITVPGKGTYTAVGQFSTPESRYYAKKYLTALREQEAELQALSRLREKLLMTRAKTGDVRTSAVASLEDRILELEKTTGKRRAELLDLRNETISREQGE